MKNYIHHLNSMNNYPFIRDLKIQDDKKPYRAMFVKQMTLKELQETKLFILNENLTKLLINTNNKIYERKLPFNNFFIDTSISANDWAYNGFVKESGSPDCYIKGIHICLSPETKTPTFSLLLPKSWIRGIEPYDSVHQDRLFIEDDISNINDNRISKFRDSNKFYHFIRLFVCNFLDFLNNPEVELVTVERTKEKNEKRILRGKYPIPTIKHIIVRGKLKIYLNELQSGGHFHYSHSFWVRGHFRTLRNPIRYGDKVGTKIWIIPYIKGKGILINKIYEVDKREKIPA